MILHLVGLPECRAGWLAARNYKRLFHAAGWRFRASLGTSVWRVVLLCSTFPAPLKMHTSFRQINEEASVISTEQRDEESQSSATAPTLEPLQNLLGYGDSRRKRLLNIRADVAYIPVQERTIKTTGSRYASFRPAGGRQYHKHFPFFRRHSR